MTAPPLAADTDRLPAQGPVLDDAGRRRVEQLLAGPVVSLHDHPVRLPDPLTPQSWQQHHVGNSDVLGVAGLAGSALDVVFASALAEPSLTRLLDWAARIGPRDDARVQLRGGWPTALDGSTTVLLALEDLDCVGENPDVVDILLAAGFRSAGLTYNAGNTLGGGLAQPVDPGLTRLGAEVLVRMQDIGMVVDLAHVGDRTSIEAAERSTRPVVVSHAGSRTLWPSARMKPDDVLRAVAATGGLIGVEAAPGSTRVEGRPGHNLAAVMAHVEHIAALVGVEHVALGPDTFFGDHAGLYKAAGWSPLPVAGQQLPVPNHVVGMENPAEAARHAAGWLVAAGWSDADVAAVLGGNAVRVLGELL